MNILTTGATGFIGYHLVRKLHASKEHHLSIITRKTSSLRWPSNISSNLEILKIDENAQNLTDLVGQAKPDICIHLASQFISQHKTADIASVNFANITFPNLLIDALAQEAPSCKFINTGTMWEHHQNLDDFHPVNLYAATKRAFEDILKYYHQAHQISAITLKFYDTFGPQDIRKKLFFLLQNFSDDWVMDFSPGDQKLNLLYIDDVIDAYIKSITYLSNESKPQYASIQIGAEKNLTLKEIVSIYNEIYKRHIKVNWGAKPYRPREIMTPLINLDLASSMLKWSPDYTLESGLKKMKESEHLID